MHIKTGQERERKVKNEGGLVSVTFGFTLLMAFWPHFNLHASTKGQTQDTVTQRTHTHTPTLAHSTAVAVAEQERVKLPLAAFYTWRLTGATGSH